MQKCIKNQNAEPINLLNMTDYETLHEPTLISRKICVTENPKVSTM